MWPNGNTKSNDHCIMGDTKLSAKMKDICISASYFFGCDWFIRDHSYYTSALYSSATWPWQTQLPQVHRTPLARWCDFVSPQIAHWAMEGKSPQKNRENSWTSWSFNKINKNMWQWFDNGASNLGKGYDKTWRSFQAFNMQKPKPNHGQLLLSR